jgi:diguanylate cyclase (GGDEF)-like protein
LGGDEFIVILTGIQLQQQVEKVSKRILLALQQPWVIEESTFFCTTSIGISLFPFTALDADQLLTNADKALYSAKAAGRNQFHFYAP